MAKVETAFAKKVDAYLKTIPNLWSLNIFGNGIQRPGVPDRLICYKGKFIGLELKRPDGKGSESPRQLIERTKITNAGGISVVVETLDEVKNLIGEIDKVKEYAKKIARETIPLIEEMSQEGYDRAIDNVIEVLESVSDKKIVRGLVILENTFIVKSKIVKVEREGNVVSIVLDGGRISPIVHESEEECIETYESLLNGLNFEE